MKIPFRSLICAPKDHYLLSIDLSQAEAWAVAYLANDPIMKYELQFGDIHTRTAITILDLDINTTRENISEEKRYTGKKCNHAFNYLMGPERAAEVINSEGQVVVTVKETKVFRKKYLELYRIEGWWLEVENTLRDNHEIITPYGFHRKCYGLGKEGLKEAVAGIPQSTIADHMYGRVQPGGTPGGLLLVDRNIIREGNRGIKLVQSAHDSGLFEAHKSIDPYELYGEIRGYLKRPMIINGEEFTIPCDAKIGNRWEEFEKLKEVA